MLTNLPAPESFDMTLAWSLGARLGAPPDPKNRTDLGTDLGSDLDRPSANRNFWLASFS